MEWLLFKYWPISFYQEREIEREHIEMNLGSIINDLSLALSDIASAPKIGIDNNVSQPEINSRDHLKSRGVSVKSTNQFLASTDSSISDLMHSGQSKPSILASKKLINSITALHKNWEQARYFIFFIHNSFNHQLYDVDILQIKVS